MGNMAYGPLVVELLGTKIHRFYRAQIEFFGVWNGPGMAHFMANMILADAGGHPGCFCVCRKYW